MICLFCIRVIKSTSRFEAIMITDTYVHGTQLSVEKIMLLGVPRYLVCTYISGPS